MRFHASSCAGQRCLSRFSAAAVLVIVLTFLAVGGGVQRSTAAEADARIDPDLVTAIALHVFRHPDSSGLPASGHPEDASGLVPVPGAVFVARKVPGIDLTTAEGQAAAGALTAEQAEVIAADSPVAASAETAANGEATLSPLGVGLYLVTERSTPAGFVPSAPFLVALPLTDPETRDRELSTVHVYPKAANAAVALSVTDRDAIAIGDVVSWSSLSGIPNLPRLDGYRVVQEIDPRLALIGGAAGGVLSIRCDPSRASCSTPLEGRDYAWSYDAATLSLTADFTSTGLALLAEAVANDPAAQVEIGYRTTVRDIGELTNRAVLYGSRAAIDGGLGAPAPVSDVASTKWGSLQVVVLERGVPTHLIPGAEVRLYGSAADAASGTDPVTVAGASQWTTDAYGRVTITGLRLSGFVDGLDRDVSDPFYRTYFVAPVSFPPGYAGQSTAIGVSVDSTTEPLVVTLLVWRVEGGLPNTGGQIPWTIAIVATLLVAFGLVIRRRRHGNRANEGGR